MISDVRWMKLIFIHLMRWIVESVGECQEKLSILCLGLMGRLNWPQVRCSMIGMVKSRFPGPSSINWGYNISSHSDVKRDVLVTSCTMTFNRVKPRFTVPQFTGSLDLSGLNSIPWKYALFLNQCKMYPDLPYKMSNFCNGIFNSNSIERLHRIWILFQTPWVEQCRPGGDRNSHSFNDLRELQGKDHQQNRLITQWLPVVILWKG